MNQSGALYFTPEGTYASSSRMAFGLPLVKHTELPLNSVGYLTAEGIYSEARPDPGFPILDRIPDGVIGAALDYLKKNPEKNPNIFIFRVLGKVYDGLSWFLGFVWNLIATGLAYAIHGITVAVKWLKSRGK